MGSGIKLKSSCLQGKACFLSQPSILSHYSLQTLTDPGNMHSRLGLRHIASLESQSLEFLFLQKWYSLNYTEKQNNPQKSNPIDVCSLSKKLVNQQQLFGEGHLESEHFWSLVLRISVFFPEWSAPSGPSLRQCQARLMARPSSWQGTFRRVSSVQEWSLFRKCYHVGWGI